MLKVSQSTINLQEDRTEVLQEEEATSTKPVPEGTEISLRILNSTHYNHDKTQPHPQKYINTAGIANNSSVDLCLLNLCHLIVYLLKFTELS